MALEGPVCAVLDGVSGPSPVAIVAPNAEGGVKILREFPQRR